MTAFLAVAALASCSPFAASVEPPDAAVAVAGEAGSVILGEGGVPEGASPSALCEPGALLCDSFEDRAGPSDLSGTHWDSQVINTKLGTITGAVSLSPSHSLEAPANVAASVALERSFQVGSTFTVRFGVRLSAGGMFAYAQIVSFVLDGAFFAVVIDKDELVAQFNDGAATSYQRTGTKVRREAWMTLAMEVRLGPSGHVILTRDAQVIYDADASTTASAAGAQAKLHLGITGGIAPFSTPKVWFDDVVAR